jgi:hypothetical protein
MNAVFSMVWHILQSQPAFLSNVLLPHMPNARRAGWTF